MARRLAMVRLAKVRLAVVRDDSGSVTPVVVVGLGLLTAAFMTLAGFVRVADAQIQTAAAAEQVALAEAHKWLQGQDMCLEPLVSSPYRLEQCAAEAGAVSVDLSRPLDLGWLRLKVVARGRYLMGS
ncbi:MAG: hypothetical protein RL441_1436 [Actinomycetota bacterium]